MHDIEPHFLWRDAYMAEKDEHSPFWGRIYDEFKYSNKLYNFCIHPQWDSFGSATLYAKILFVDYEESYVLIELLGEWNDTLYNDIMFLKRNVVDPLILKGISKFVFFCDNVLNFHASIDDDYYAEWAEEVTEDGGWIVFLNTRKHVEEEMHEARINLYAHFGTKYNDVNWRAQKPGFLFQILQESVLIGMRNLPD
ncbi:MAG: hypothetical protein ACKVT2_00610 [Saprospiraceae bacterium]